MALGSVNFIRRIMSFLFEDYLSSVNLVELKKAIKTNSTATLVYALDYYRKQVNDKAVLTEYDVRAEMVDRRTTDAATANREGWGNTYQIFSDKYVEKYNMPHWWALKLDMFSILELLNGKKAITEGVDTEIPAGVLSGDVGFIIVDTQTGEKIVTIKNPDNKEYEVFTMLDETASINDRVDKVDFKNFKLSLFSFKTFEKEPLDCSVVSVEVSYVVVFR